MWVVVSFVIILLHPCFDYCYFLGSDEELDWLLEAFATRCFQIQKIKSETPQTSETVPGTIQSKKRPKSFSQTLENCTIQKDDAINSIVVFNQNFSNYPPLAERFWNVITIDSETKTYCTFSDYVSFAYKISRGSWKDKSEVYFNFLNAKRNGTITRTSVTDAINEVGEYMSNLSCGVINYHEFYAMKKKQIDLLFGDNFQLSLDQFEKASLKCPNVTGCCDIMEMVFGRVIKKMEMDLKKELIFGRYLQENTKDVTGEYMFVPEVISSAMEILKEHNALGTPGKFTHPWMQLNI